MHHTSHTCMHTHASHACMHARASHMCVTYVHAHAWHLCMHMHHIHAHASHTCMHHGIVCMLLVYVHMHMCVRLICAFSVCSSIMSLPCVRTCVFAYIWRYLCAQVYLCMYYARTYIGILCGWGHTDDKLSSVVSLYLYAMSVCSSATCPHTNWLYDICRCLPIIHVILCYDVLFRWLQQLLTNWRPPPLFVFAKITVSKILLHAFSRLNMFYHNFFKVNQSKFGYYYLSSVLVLHNNLE